MGIFSCDTSWSVDKCWQKTQFPVIGWFPCSLCAHPLCTFFFHIALHPQGQIINAVQIWFLTLILVALMPGTGRALLLAFVHRDEPVNLFCLFLHVLMQLELIVHSYVIPCLPTVSQLILLLFLTLYCSRFHVFGCRLEDNLYSILDMIDISRGPNTWFACSIIISWLRMMEVIFKTCVNVCISSSEENMSTCFPSW